MSKSFGNYVGITEPPKDMFGKLMSIPDDLMWSYYELLTDLSQTEIDSMKKKVGSGELHPKKAKENLAAQIVDSFHPVEIADTGSSVPMTLGTSTAAEFNSIFRDGKAPSEVPEWKLTRVPGGLMCFLRTSPNVVESLTASLPSGQIKWSKLLADLELVVSTSEAERIIKGNGFEVNKKVVSDPSARINVDLPGLYEVRVGKKKFARIVVDVPK